MQKHTLKISGPELDRRLEEVNNIPTKTSELENDSNFISEGVVDWVDSVGEPGHIKNRTHCLDYPLGVLNKDVTSLNIGSHNQIYVLFPNNRIEILKPNEVIPVSHGILNLVYEDYNVYLQEVIDNGINIINPNIRLFGYIEKLSEVFIPDSIARKEDIGDTFKKEIFTFESDNGHSVVLNLPNKNTVVNITYDDEKVNLYKNIPLSYSTESNDGNFAWDINWDGKGNLEIKEGFQELLLLEHFEIYQYAEDIDEILIPSSIPRKNEFKTINNQSILGDGDITISGGTSAVVDDAFSETSKNPVQNKVVTEAINGLKNSVNALYIEVGNLGDIVEGYSDAITNAKTIAEGAAKAVQTVAKQVDSISTEVHVLSNKVESLENGEITWTDVP